jgi:acyl CoA:acetate/3-ketoacid CoA transferase alpha subunit
MQNKVYLSSASALDGILFDGMSIMCGGFGLCGIPENLISQIQRSKVANLTSFTLKDKSAVRTKALVLSACMGDLFIF